MQTFFEILSERRESNPRGQLGRLMHYHCATLAFSGSQIPVKGSILIASGAIPSSSLTIFSIALENPGVPTM